jgi:hypothetical protein
MATRFLSNEGLWNEIQTRLTSKRRVRAAVAYFGSGGAALLKLKRGDILVVDMSIGAVRQGITNPRDIRKLIRRGVKVFTRGSLHAKFLMIDDTLIASSANASHNSKESLDEAGIITTDAAALRRASKFFDDLCTEPVREEYLKKCIAEYRPPRFKPAVEGQRTGAKRSRRVIEAKLWFVSGLVALNLTEEAQNSIEKIESRNVKRLMRPDASEVSWIRYRKLPKLLRNIRIGDWVVDCMKDGTSRHVGPPMQFLGMDKWVSSRGTQYSMLMLETPSVGESVTLGEFRQRVASFLPNLNRANPRTTAIADDESADRILRLWNTSGKWRKR